MYSDLSGQNLEILPKARAVDVGVDPGNDTQIDSYGVFVKTEFLAREGHPLKTAGMAKELPGNV